jgi:uncharacterized protein (DUF1684 family)
MNCLMRTLPFFFFFLVSCQGGNPSETSTEEGNKNNATEVGAMRKQKDNAFVTDPGSPFAELLEDFKGLEYFPVDENARVKVQLQPFASGAQQRIITDTKGKPRLMKQLGNFEFKYKGTLCRLPALMFADDSSHYFVMFKDKTNGTETYGGGRYIEMPVFDRDGVLDFNQAYNPYCHYNHNYACPIVPNDCVLTVRIEAGERMYDKQAEGSQH